jgi:hypothetical protein
MAKTYFVRIEPRATASSLENGLAARLHDPLWMLGRQWQFGEFLGEDAGTPVSIELDAESALISQYLPAGGEVPISFDPQATPLEVVVEAESQRTRGTWTARLRIDTGRAFLRALEDAGLAQYARAFLDAYPLDAASAMLQSEDPAGARLLNLASGRVPDGQQLFIDFAQPVRTNAALPNVPNVGASPDQLKAVAKVWLAWCDDTIEEGGENAWQGGTLDYSFALSTAGVNGTMLSAEGYRGSSLEWHAFDARGNPGHGGFSALPRMSALPTGVRFRGMPNARWWEFEDASVDMGSVDAGPTDVARMAVLEFAFVYGNDFFAVPLRLPIGSLTRITSLVVADTFGMRLSVRSANLRQGKQGARRFSLFALTQVNAAAPSADELADALFLAPVAVQVLASPPIEEVLLLRDEMANLAWAVERRYEGERGLALERHETAVLLAPPSNSPSRNPELQYRLGTSVPPYWFPLVPVNVEGGVQLELQRMTNQLVTVAPRGRLLDFGGPAIPDAEVTREGTRLLRQYAMTRWANGRVFAWSKIRREVGRGEGSSGLRFDLVEPA